jgi:hypothetical protein
LRERVFRFRHSVYCVEMGLPLTAAGGRLTDAFDAYSTSLLLERDGVPVGTIRWTRRSDGPLEIEHRPEWAERISAWAEHDEVADLTRLMVHRSLRGREALPQLVRAVVDACIDEGTRFLVFAGKIGAGERLYGQLGARRLDDQVLPYLVDGHVMGHYRLMGFDFAGDRPHIEACLDRALGRSLCAA